MINRQDQKGALGKGLLLWMIGIPLPVVILLYMFGVFH